MNSVRYEFEAIGTHWVIDLHENSLPLKEGNFIDQIKKRIYLFENTYSRFKPDSLVSRISKTDGEFELPFDAKELFDIYKKMYFFTDGLFTPLIGGVLNDSGYNPDYSLQPRQLKKPPSWEEVIDYNFPKLKIKKEATFDFGAAGKGYLIDLVAEMISSFGIKNFCVDAGGDILYRKRDDESLQVGLENPLNFSEVIGIAELKSESLAGSSGSRRKWGKFHHIINPFTLESPRGILATWVVAKTTILADALSTCLFFVAPKKLKSVGTFEYVILNQDFSVEVSTGFRGRLFVS